jgi:hypothetical protein
MYVNYALAHCNQPECAQYFAIFRRNDFNQPSILIADKPLTIKNNDEH